MTMNVRGYWLARGLTQALQGSSFTAAPVKAMLVGTTWVDGGDDILTVYLGDELTATGYTAGGVVVDNPHGQFDGTSESGDTAKLVCEPVNFGVLSDPDSAVKAVIFYQPDIYGSNVVICADVFDTPIAITGTDPIYYYAGSSGLIEYTHS